MKNIIRRTHIIRLILRSALFLATLGLYIFDRANDIYDQLEFGRSPLIAAIWLVFLVDMILRFFPSRFESMGCQKQFKKNFVPRDKTPLSDSVRRKNRRSVIIIAALWLGLNGIFGALYLAGIFDRGIMLLIALFYSVCDVICILFYCPFQSLIMKNRCCVTCRIYNWDFAMMCTPLLFVPSFYTWSLGAVSLALLLDWEILYHRHPERFSETTNCSLDCKKCTEHLCKHKKAIRTLAKKTRQIIGDFDPVQTVQKFTKKK